MLRPDHADERLGVRAEEFTVNFELSDDRTMAEFLEGVVQEVFEVAADGEAFDERPSYHVDKFSRLGIGIRAFDSGESQLGVSLDDPNKTGFRIAR